MRRIPIIALAAVIASCAHQPRTTPATGLRGSSWRAENIDGRGKEDGAAATMTFDSSSVVTGNTSCSEYSAVATIQGAKLTFATVSTKHQECSPALADQERRFQKALFYVRSYRIDSGGSLHLLDGDDHERMRLAPASPPR